MGTDKNGRKTAPVFKRITSNKEAAEVEEKFNYEDTPETPQPSVAPAGKPPEAASPVPLAPESKPSVAPSVQPTPPKEMSEVAETEQQVKEEVRASLREHAREVATKKYSREVIDTLEKALANPQIKGVRWGVVGLGQGGGRLAEQFYKLGYPACIANTAKQDLTFIDIPEKQKLFMDYALGGAGKDMSVGEAAIQEYQSDVLKLMQDSFDNDVETIVVCVCGGGGTGSGGAIPLIKMVSKFGLPVVVLFTLPMLSEGALTKSNTIRVLERIAKLSQNEVINALVIADNSKIEQLYPSIAASQFWKAANFDIVNVLNTFNTLCRCDTDFDALDPMDFARIFSTGNCTIFGKIEVPVSIVDGQVSMFEGDIANALVQNIQGGLLADGFELKDTVSGGVIITGREEILSQIPAISIHYAYDELNRLVGDANIYRGLYNDSNRKDCLTVYSIFSGLGLPYTRVQKLKQEAQNAMNAVENKASDKSKMEISAEPDSVNDEQQRYDNIRQRNTAYGRLVNRRGKRRLGRG